MKNYHVVIPAAGQGKRMKTGRNKQFLLIDHIPLLVHTLRVFEEDLLCSEIVLVVNQEEIAMMKDLMKEYSIAKVSHFVVGGKERQNSVHEGLKVLSGNPVVLIHDGARPFIRIQVIKELVASVEETGAAIVGVPVKDTIKQVNGTLVEKTVERNHLWSIQTPQAFYLKNILQAHETAVKQGYIGTDDASLMEYMNQPVSIIEGGYDNFKVTTPEDLLFAEAIIQKRKGEKES
ncbi:2-C-methyl-D-erythritol 4-phosphate cytidylyltransferase [Salipaludibacillus sp. CF4.18]|uniref:2-C-methyl-D-erythritol 4-phosphate cytidylyltransferase n=1 Tax=Salipaludibacillus sp. CF4.18 TaxID=3373081 RepID=UPI003EE76A30